MKKIYKISVGNCLFLYLTILLQNIFSLLLYVPFMSTLRRTPVLLSLIWCTIGFCMYLIIIQLNYILNDWGRELSVDVENRTVTISTKKETRIFDFLEIDSIRVFRYYYRIRLKKNGDIIYMSKLTVRKLEKELSDIPFYYEKDDFTSLSIPCWKRPSKRPLIHKDPRWVNK